MNDSNAPATRSLSATEPSLAVVERVAELEGTNPTDLTPPLYAAIDPEALDSLFQSSAGAERRPKTQISFPYCGYDVTVAGDGEITVSERS